MPKNIENAADKVMRTSMLNKFQHIFGSNQAQTSIWGTIIKQNNSSTKLINTDLPTIKQ